MASVRATSGAGSALLLMLIVAVSDSAQYLHGPAFGRRKLAPAVSPAKTVEGAIGGLVVRRRSLAPSLARGVCTWRRSAARRARSSACVVAAFGMVGDLFESLLKRSAGVKDSSTLIPGPRRRARSHRQPSVRRAVLLRGADGCARVKRVAILGSTGSIGRSALAVVDAHPDRLQVVALAAGENAELLAEQVAQYRPRVVGVATDAARDELVRAARRGRRADVVGVGREGCSRRATHPDVDLVLCASSGTAGLEAALAAIDAGKTLALANKEVLVMAGALMMDAARRRGVAILPVDSEHNAIHQCLHGRSRARSAG